MTKKSAASAKLKEAKETLDPKANFEHYKEIQLQLLKTKKILCNRVDTGTNLRAYYRSFFGELPDFNKVESMVQLVNNLCDQMIEIVEGFKFEDFTVEEMDDPYEDLLITLDRIDNDTALFLASIRFNFVRPFAERVLQVHNLIVEECEEAGIPVTKGAKE